MSLFQSYLNSTKDKKMSEQNCGCHSEKADIQSITSFSSCGQGKFHPAGDEVRQADAKIDFVYPEVPFPSKRVCAIVGADKIREMVFYHHTLLRNSAVGDLFPKDDEMFRKGTEKTAEFFIEALGGGWNAAQLTSQKSGGE